MSLEQVFEKAGTDQVSLVKEGNIFFLVLNRPFNLIDFDFIKKVNKCLDEVENSKDEDAVMVTIGSGSKVFCSGFNLKILGKGDVHSVALGLMLNPLMARILTLNVPTLCVFNGYSVAAGVFMGMCHD